MLVCFLKFPLHLTVDCRDSAKDAKLLLFYTDSIEFNISGVVL